MSILTVENVTHSFGGRQILENASFRLLKGEHIGLVGANGEGKTTLLNIITGKLAPDMGKIEWCNRITTGYLDQYTSLTPGKTIRDVLKEAFQTMYDDEKLLLEMYDRMGNCDEEELEKLIFETGEIQSHLEHCGFYAIESKIEEVANGLGLGSIGLDKDVTNLSGGQRSKVLLTKLLLEQPMILILDEPTNFLDEEHVTWLTKYLQDYENAFILVSHDIPFLNSVINIILHMENAELTRYSGDYDYFLQMHELKKKQVENAYNKQQKEIARLEDFISRNKARVATTNLAKSRQKILDKMDVIEIAKEKVKPTFKFKEARTPGKVIFRLNNVVLGYDNPLTTPIHYELERGKKIALKGVNGIGKSTLLKTMLGIIPPINGSIEMDPYVEYGYFIQEEDGGRKTAFDEVWDAFPRLNHGEVRSALAKCGLTSEHIMSPVMVLSGGEKAKVRLCKIMMNEINFLVLDEPTNHLDVMAKEELKRALKEYKGTILLVSHEPEFYLDIVDEVVNLEEFTLKII